MVYHNHEVIEQVPLDYYQHGVKHNFFQKLWHSRKLEIVTKKIPVSAEKILDVGCASGWFISNIAKRFLKATCYGIDIYDEAITYAKSLYPSINFKTADAHTIPYKDNTFDTLICTEVLKYVDDPKTVLIEIKRTIKQNGIAIIELDSGSILFSLIWFLWTRLRGTVWNHAHLHSFNIKKLTKMINTCGFSIIYK